MAVSAQALDVVVGVWPILGEGDDVVRDGSGGDAASGITVAAQGLGSEAALALLYGAAAPEAFGHQPSRHIDHFAM